MFIVLYGVNNLGKSTQAKLLVERLRKEGYAAEYLKYPVYDLEPSGPLINEYLRGGNPDELSRREVQILYAFNRTQFEPMLEKKLTAGIHIVAEDYIGTGLAWGVATGVDKKFLTRLNCRLRPEDLAFVFDGERFIEATESSTRLSSRWSRLQARKTSCCVSTE